MADKEILELPGILSEGYGLAPKKLATDTSLSDASYRLWTLLSIYANGGVKCFPKQEELAKDLGVCNATISVNIKELCRAGLILKERQPDRSLVYTLNFSGTEVLPPPVKIDGTSPLFEKLKEYSKDRKTKREKTAVKIQQTRAEAKLKLDNFYAQFGDGFEVTFDNALRAAGYKPGTIESANFATNALKEHGKEKVVDGVQNYLDHYNKGILKRVSWKSKQLLNYIASSRVGPRATTATALRNTVMSGIIINNQIRGESEGGAFVPFELRYLYTCQSCHTPNIEGLTEKCPVCQKYLDWNSIGNMTEDMQKERKVSLTKQKASFSWSK